jgi:hypothetical protein
MSDQADQADLAKARQLFRRFQARDAKKDELILVGGLVKPAVALEVGTLISIGYKALGDGEKYYHEFESPLAKVYVNASGDQIFFIGGAYRFTERGFVR